MLFYSNLFIDNLEDRILNMMSFFKKKSYITKSYHFFSVRLIYNKGYLYEEIKDC